MDTQNNAIDHMVNQFLQRLWANQKSRSTDRIAHGITAEQLKELKKIGIQSEGRSVEAVANEMIEKIYPYGNNCSHPRFFGFIPAAPSPLSWLGDVMTSAYNLHAGSWVNCPAASLIEQELIGWLCGQAGYPEKSGGTFVSGGSMANMTAMTAARDKLLAEDQLHLGVAYVSSQTHSSVAKGLRIIGIPNSRVRKISTGADFRMDMEQLKSAVQSDITAGLIPFLVIATAGTTNTGSIDPLEEIADLCQSFNLWMHVDGAYGASVLLTKKYKHLLKGIERSDSISWDAHKWLVQTFGCGIVLIKDKKDLVNSFSTQPEYLKDLVAEDHCINPWDIGMELTRPARGLKLWFTIQVLGLDALSAAIEHGFLLAKWAEEELQKNEEIEIISHAQLSIVNFRYAPCGLSEAEKDELNLQVSKRMLEDGYAGIFTTILNGKKVLRICALHPDTKEDEIRSTVKRMNQYYKETYQLMK